MGERPLNESGETVNDVRAGVVGMMGLVCTLGTPEVETLAARIVDRVVVSCARTLEGMTGDGILLAAALRDVYRIGPSNR